MVVVVVGAGVQNLLLAAALFVSVSVCSCGSGGRESGPLAAVRHGRTGESTPDPPPSDSATRRFACGYSRNGRSGCLASNQCLCSSMVKAAPISTCCRHLGSCTLPLVPRFRSYITAPLSCLSELIRNDEDASACETACCSRPLPEKSGSVAQSPACPCLLLATCVGKVCKWRGPVINMAPKRTVDPPWNDRRCFVTELNTSLSWEQRAYSPTPTSCPLPTESARRRCRSMNYGADVCRGGRRTLGPRGRARAEGGGEEG